MLNRKLKLVLLPLDERPSLPNKRAYPNFVRVAGVYAPSHLGGSVLRGAYHLEK